MISSDATLQNNSGFISIASGGCFSGVSGEFPPVLKPSAYYLLYCTGGSGKLSLGKEKGNLLFSSDCLSLFSSDQPLALTRNNQAFSFYLYEIYGGSVSAYHSLIGNSSLSLQNFPQKKEVSPLFQTLQRVTEHSKSISPVISNKLFTDLFTDLFFWQQKPEGSHSDFPRHVADLKNWCDTHYSDKFSLDELAELFGISKYKLCRDFSNYYDISPLQYLNRQRISSAKKLLITTTDCIYEIGNAVGIENTNHFINLFKKYTGTTPNEFRHSHLSF